MTKIYFFPVDQTKPNSTIFRPHEEDWSTKMVRLGGPQLIAPLSIYNKILLCDIFTKNY